jgi:RNA polymerase sigma-70 factor, ECF subfamily
MDEERFSGFFAENFDDVWRFARRRTHAPAEADDVAAETFAVAWRRRVHIPTGKEARLWLFGVARNVIANQRRAAERRGRLHLRLVTSAAMPESYEPSRRSEEVLWTALAALVEHDRELLLMRAWDELDVAEIAVILGISAATVSSRLYKARRRLTDELPGEIRSGADMYRVNPHGERSDGHEWSRRFRRATSRWHRPGSP